MPMDFGSRLDTRKRSLVQLHRVAIVGGSFSDFHTFKHFKNETKHCFSRLFSPSGPQGVHIKHPTFAGRTKEDDCPPGHPAEDKCPEGRDDCNLFPGGNPSLSVFKRPRGR